MQNSVNWKMKSQNNVLMLYCKGTFISAFNPATLKWSNSHAVPKRIRNDYETRNSLARVSKRVSIEDLRSR